MRAVQPNSIACVAVHCLLSTTVGSPLAMQTR